MAKDHKCTCRIGDFLQTVEDASADIAPGHPVVCVIGTSKGIAMTVRHIPRDRLLEFMRAATARVERDDRESAATVAWPAGEPS